MLLYNHHSIILLRVLYGQSFRMHFSIVYEKRKYIGLAATIWVIANMVGISHHVCIFFMFCSQCIWFHMSKILTQFMFCDLTSLYSGYGTVFFFKRPSPWSSLLWHKVTTATHQNGALPWSPKWNHCWLTLEAYLWIFD